MTAKELAEAILKLPEDQQKLRIGYFYFPIASGNPRFYPYDNVSATNVLGLDCVVLSRDSTVESIELQK